MTRLGRAFKILCDPAVTLLIWCYFIFGFLALFAIRYFWAWLFAAEKEAAFQRLNQRYFHSFFTVLERITPGLMMRIDRQIGAIRSAVVVSNHLSYLDSILLVSLFERQKTIVKHTFFKVPIFGGLLRGSGYLAAPGGGSDSALTVENCEAVKRHLAAGGIVFIFPEGTRSRTGLLGPFSRGAFSIAHYCRAPIHCLRIRNTHRLFLPGRFLFNTGLPNTIAVERIGVFSPDYGGPGFSLADLVREIRVLYEEKLKDNSIN
jgi:1-acyl-sn-glycerol-3-phosphate acyltransferase